jgi:hypothetical protein
MVETARTTSSKMSIRESLLRKAVGLTAVGTLSFGAASCSGSDTSASQRTESPTAASLDQWRLKPSTERINDLESSSFRMEGINYAPELVSAVADFYCANVPCTMGAEALKQRTQFVASDRILAEVEKIEGPYTPEKKEHDRQYRIEIVTADKQNVLMNVDSFDPLVALLTQTDPALIADLISQGKNPKNYLIRTVLLHAFSHVTATHPDIVIEGHSLQLRDASVPILNEIVDFRYTGTQPDGSRPIINGLDEAVAEFIAQKTGNKLDKQYGYYSINNIYNEGALLLSIINEGIGVSDEEFMEYATGKKPLVEYLIRIGTKINGVRGTQDNNLNTGSFPLFLIAGHGEGVIDLGSAISFITHDLGMTTPEG